MSKRSSVVMAVCTAFLFFLCTLPLSAQDSTADPDVTKDRARALELYDQNNYKDALPLLEKIAPQLPKDVVVQERWGMSILANAAAITDIEQRKKERQRARKALLHAKELGDNSNLLQILLEGIPEDGSTSAFSDNKEVDKIMRESEAAFVSGDMKRALDGYLKVLLIDPNQYYAALFAGDAYYKQKQYFSAGEYFGRAIQITPDAETAYRYWGDSLMAWGKMDEARSKFIDAIIANPYTKAPWIGLIQWADRNNMKVGHPEIKKSSSFSVQDESHVNINLDAASLKTKDGSSTWMMYGISRAGWHGDRFKKEFPNEKEYRHTLREESSALDLVTVSLQEQKIKKLEPGLATLLKLKQAGLIEAYVLLATPDAGIAQDYAAYRKDHRDKLRQYIEQFVIQKK